MAGNPFEMNFRVPAAKLKLRRMLPVFQRMSDTFNDMGVAAIEANGKSISCTAGSWRTSCRQMVPVSEAEAFDLRDVIERMPEERAVVVKQRFADGLERLAKISFFERLESASRSDPEKYSAALREVFLAADSVPVP